MVNSGTEALDGVGKSEGVAMGGYRRVVAAAAALMLLLPLAATPVSATMWNAPDNPPAMHLVSLGSGRMAVHAEWPEAVAGGVCYWRLADASGTEIRRLGTTQSRDGGCVPRVIRLSSRPVTVVMIYDGPPGSGLVAEGRLAVERHSCQPLTHLTQTGSPPVDQVPRG